MADLSLDEFIRKNNVKVQVNNTAKGPQHKAKFKPKPVRPGVVFDARQKLGARAPIVDARDKIIVNKKSGNGDARNKIVSKQVQQGKFDARSLIQRHKKTAQPAAFTNNPPGAPVPNLALTRTLSNPDAKGKFQVQLTDDGLKVTRPLSAQVRKRVNRVAKNFSNAGAGLEKDFVPIIQIRNDRYKQPAAPVAVQSSQQMYRKNATEPSYHYSDPAQGFSYASNPIPAFSTQRGYQDLDDPQYNSASIADIPKFHVSNVRPVENAGMRPVSYSSQRPVAYSTQQPITRPVSYSSQQTARAPPGAATLSQGAPVSRPLQVAAKRRQPAPPPAQELSGPLRLGRGGGPGIELRPTVGHNNGASYVKRAKYEGATDERPPLEEDDGTDLISPLQGFRVLVTNLFTGVTQDDIIELFGAVGPLKKAKLLKAGSAEVVYISRKDAHSAVQKYHSRELDGQPMYVKMTTPAAAVIKKPVGEQDPDITGEALRLYKKGTGIGSLPEAPIEIPTIHRALFKAGPPGPNKSVKFTVKI